MPSGERHFFRSINCVSILLETDVSLDVDVGTINVCSIHGHVNIGGPVIVSPFYIQAVIGLQSSSQRTIVAKGAFPFNRNVATVVDSGCNSVVGVKLLRNCHFLVVSRCCQTNVGIVQLMVDGDFLVVSRCGELDLGVIHAVLDIDFLIVSGCGESDIGGSIVIAENDVGLFRFHVVSGVDGDTSTIDIKSLGGFNLSDIEAAASRCGETKRKVGILVVGIDF